MIQASGYYEWRATPSGKQPYYITAADGSVLSFASLWDEWHDIETGEAVKSCTLIVAAANDLTSKIHDRMPVILGAEHLGDWLGGTGSVDLLKPAPENLLRMWPVSRRVNRAGNDNDPTLIEAIR